MPSLPLLLLLLLIAPAAHGQVLIDTMGAAAIQGTLQGASAPGYTNLLRSVEGRIQDLGAGSRGGSFTGPPAAGSSTPIAPASVTRSAPGEPGAETQFVVNSRVIRLCPSGLSCLGQVRRAMGMP